MVKRLFAVPISSMVCVNYLFLSLYKEIYCSVKICANDVEF
jgi:hypothetical protein